MSPLQTPMGPKLQAVILILDDGRSVEIPVDKLRSVTLSTDSRWPYLDQEGLLTIIMEWKQFYYTQQKENKPNAGDLMSANPQDRNGTG